MLTGGTTALLCERDFRGEEQEEERALSIEWKLVGK